MTADAQGSRAADTLTWRAVGMVSRWVVVLALGASVAAFLGWGVDRGIGVAAGGALASAWWTVSSVLARRIARAEERASVGWSVFFAAMTGVALLAAAILLMVVDTSGLAIGFGTLVVGVIAGAIEAHVRLDR
jgi:dipeptide/tripeptide permease